MLLVIRGDLKRPHYKKTGFGTPCTTKKEEGRVGDPSPTLRIIIRNAMWYLNTGGAKEAHHQRVAPRGQPKGLHSEGQEAPRGLHYKKKKRDGSETRPLH